MKRTCTAVFVLTVATLSAVATGSTEREELAELHASLATKYFEAERSLEGGGAPYAERATHLLAMAAHHIRAARALGDSSETAELEQQMAKAYAKQYLRGIVALEADNPQEAVRAFRLAAVADPDDYRSYYGRSEAHWRLALQIQHTDPAAFRWEVTEAIVNLQRVVESDAAETPILLRAHRTIGDMHDKLGDHAAAEAAYKDALTLDPSDESARRRLSEINAKKTH